MNNVYLGILIGLFLYFGGQRFFVWLVETLKERKVKDLRKTEEALQKMVDKVFEKGK